MSGPPMAACNPPPTARQEAFDLFELLEQLPDVFAQHFLSALEPHHLAVLALTCSSMRKAVQQSASTLALRAGSCCHSRHHQLAQTLPNIKQALLKPGNLHEALCVLPLFCMEAARHMTGLTSLVLHDLLPDRSPDEVACGSCTAWTSTYDLSAVLATAAHCMPHLAALSFTTHYISDAECAAIGLMTGLTRLQLRSTHGTHVGGLSHISNLPALAHLEARDRGHASQTSARDLTALLGATRLTHLTLGPHSLTAQLLCALEDMHQQQQQQQQQEGRVGAVRTSVLSSSSLAQPPPLQSLQVVLYPLPHLQRAFASACTLTSLTSLRLGWIPGPLNPAHPHDVSPTWPIAEQCELSQLTNLQDLAIGWTPQPEVLEALGHISCLTALQLGGLFSALPEAPSAWQLRLPGVVRLTVQLETAHAVLAAQPASPDPLSAASCVDALAAFPGLTRLELAGRLYGAPLKALPQVLPRQSLCELLLPQRLGGSRDDLCALKQLRGLTHLRIGWRSLYHQGPAGYPPASFGDDAQDQQQEHAQEQEQQQQEQQQHEQEQEQLQEQEEEEEEQEQGEEQHQQEEEEEEEEDEEQLQQQSPLSLEALVEQPVSSECDCLAWSPGNSAGSAASSDPHATASAASTTSDAAALADCTVCGARASSGCLCRLRVLEVVGPLPPYELAHLCRLPALKHLVLRDNNSWSTGHTAGLVQLLSHLTLLELHMCRGVSGFKLEQLRMRELELSQRASATAATTTQQLLAAAAAATPAAAAAARQGDALSNGEPDSAQQPAVPQSPQLGSSHALPRQTYEGARVVVHPHSGCTAAELGRGHHCMGVVLLPCEECGLQPGEFSGAASTEALPPEPGVPQQYPRFQGPLMERWHTAIRLRQVPVLLAEAGMMPLPLLDNASLEMLHQLALELEQHFQAAQGHQFYHGFAP